MGKFILGDCMDLETGLPSYPDNYFDLAIVDPPYGGGQHFNFRFGVGEQVYSSDKTDRQNIYLCLRV